MGSLCARELFGPTECAAQKRVEPQRQCGVCVVQQRQTVVARQGAQENGEWQKWKVDGGRPAAGEREGTALPPTPTGYGKTWCARVKESCFAEPSRVFQVRGLAGATAPSRRSECACERHVLQAAVRERQARWWCHVYRLPVEEHRITDSPPVQWGGCMCWKMLGAAAMP